MNGTVIRTVLVIATCLNTAMLSTDFAQFHNPTVDMVYRVMSVILNFIIVACATWFNNDYTDEARIGTGVTRQLKAEQNDDYIGELFFTDEEEEEELEDFTDDGEEEGEIDE